ncbi:MAG: glycosyltransferase family 39 protein, partial [Clostridia bacterium]|nr:glycosyltransferase family 39 protein [Clostridia bacterium]
MIAIAQDIKSCQGKTVVWLVAATVFLLECAAGYYYNVYIGYHHTDGISRVANAFYVLYSRDPHLGAIGFVWNPLPSFVNLFFLLLYPWIPEMATQGIAGLLMSALFASATAFILSRAFIRRGLPRWVAVVFPLLFLLNPMMFLFGFNGMSDAPFIFFIILSILGFLNWLETRRIGELTIASFALALSFWCRYEAVPFGFSVIGAVIIAALFFQQNHLPVKEGLLRYRWSRAEAAITVIASPLVYSILLWVLLNAIIMHNPLYFLNGEYTNIAQIEGHLDNPVYAAMLDNPVNAAWFAAKKILVFSAPLISILLLRLFNRRFWQGDTLILLGMFVSIPLLQIVMLMKGTSLGWLRYFIYVLPVSFAWLPYELSKLKRKEQALIPLLALIITFGLLSYAVTQPAIAPDENRFLQNSFGHRSESYEDLQLGVEISQ